MIILPVSSEFFAASATSTALAPSIPETSGSLPFSTDERKSKISFLELPSDDPKQRKPDIEMAKEKLNWEPNINLDEGLDKTIDFFRFLLS